MKRIVLALLLFAGAVGAAPTISNLKVESYSPWGKCYVTFNLSEEMGANDKLWLQIKGTSYQHFFAKSEVTGTTSCKVLWDLRADGISVNSTSLSIEAVIVINPQYLVIDLSSGSSSSKYPVTYMSEPPSGGFNVDAYKTTKLVMRRIEPGTYKMDGSVSTTITKLFYIGLFEVTQKQWSLVMGANPAHDRGVGDTYPVYYVSYDDIRGSSNGAKWPSSSAVDSSSFLGKLRARTEIDFDLPTDAQWEYACRAGTTTTYYWGNSMNGDYAWYEGNSGLMTHPVGGKTANAWGLYDMSGNVFEWCLDWYGSLTGGSDPKGAASGSFRVTRGGSWHYDAYGCTSSSRNIDGPSIHYFGNGFRLASHPGL